MFIKVNGIILDEREYHRKAILLRKLVGYEFSEIIRKYGFRKKEDFFVHEETGIKVKLFFEEPEGKPL